MQSVSFFIDGYAVSSAIDPARLPKRSEGRQANEIKLTNFYVIARP